ncbi:MAG: hypothetical protein JO108_15595, partial [Acidobacteriaceae bacterium]|nr:hypothetical protein [Acidobacteriaceae bacterium]
MMLRLVAAALLSASLAVFASADQREASAPSGSSEAAVPTNPRPPYLLSQLDVLTIVFEAEESALKSLLPAGIKPAAGNTVGLNMYRAQQAVGLVPYTASYLWINIDGFDSPDGTKGRWMVQGWYGPEPATTVFRTQMGFPVQVGATGYER